MGNTLYHYCSLETFLSIIKNKTLRASDCSKTNDSEETRWISSTIENTLLDILRESSLLSKEGFLIDLTLDFFKYDISKVIENIFYKNSREMITFITCFSENGDLLSQWRGYANDAKGVSIGFNKKLLQSFDTSGSTYFFNKVIYKPEEQNEYIINSFSDLVRSYELLGKRLTQDMLENFIMDLSSKIATARNDSPKFKNIAFREEKEWRFFANFHFPNVYCDDYDNDTIGFDENLKKQNDLKNGFIRKPLEFRATDTKIIPYFDLDYSKVKNKFIKEIIIGSKCKMSTFDIQLLLEAHGYDSSKIMIRKSDATYQ